MNKTEFYERMKNLLLKIPGASLASGGREVVMKCRYCDDRAKHMYVSLPVDNNIMLFNCFRASCQAKGIVTHDKLIEWGVYESPDDLIEVTKYNKRVSSLDKNRKFNDRDVYKLNNTFVSQNRLSELKLTYINKRIGTQMTYDDVLRNKIILNLKDLLDANNITKYTRHNNIIEQLDESFIGFISQDNAFVNMRNLREGKVYDSIDKRYINYNIFNKIDNTQRFYTIPANIDLCNPNRIKLHVAEGPFDILSIYYNLRHQEPHSIYSAILGGHYLSIIKHFINRMKLINLEIHIYMDNDVSNTILYEIGDILAVYQIPCYIHRNMYEGEKDFGVPLDRINEQIYRLI